ncbi:MAG: N-acetylmuramic acid 6-phosphate etherase [Rhizobiaceae bacterium]|nr:N-acetylmuramic acid 6-phosphate etherase [Rhizobiaceae bacterium]
MEVSTTNSPATESLHASAAGIDGRSPDQILGLIHQGQLAATDAVKHGLGQIAAAAKHMAECHLAGGKLIYVGAGSSGLMALADGLELPGTFGIPMSQIRILFAGGNESLADMKGGPEDDEEQARKDVNAAGIEPGDCAILVSASGTTPYTLAAQRLLQSLGATSVGLANNQPSPLLDNSDFPVFLATPPEVIAGSTRMGAGTSQKIALNMLSTLMGIHLGHVHDGMMVNLVADNAKLQDRARRMVTKIAKCNEQTADHALACADGSVKIAVLLAAGQKNVKQAQQLLAANRGKLRAALSDLTVSQTSD